VQVLLGLTIPISIVVMIGLRPLLAAIFHFDTAGTDLLLWTTRGFMLGLAGQTLLEVGNRAFYARQNALIPLAGSALNIVIYTVHGYTALPVDGRSRHQSDRFCGFHHSGSRDPAGFKWALAQQDPYRANSRASNAGGFGGWRGMPGHFYLAKWKDFASRRWGSQYVPGWACAAAPDLA